MPRTDQPELCAKCGVELHDNLRPARLCPKHLAEARAEAGPIACTDADLREGPTADEPCPHCDHAKRLHGWDGCEQHITVFTYGELVHDGPCGCEEWDPMCTAIETGESFETPASVTALPSGGLPVEGSE